MLLLDMAQARQRAQQANANLVVNIFLYNIRSSAHYIKERMRSLQRAILEIASTLQSGSAEHTSATAVLMIFARPTVAYPDEIIIALDALQYVNTELRNLPRSSRLRAMYTSTLEFSMDIAAYLDFRLRVSGPAYLENALGFVYHRLIMSYHASDLMPERVNHFLGALRHAINGTKQYPPCQPQLMAHVSATANPLIIAEPQPLIAAVSGPSSSLPLLLPKSTAAVAISCSVNAVATGLTNVAATVMMGYQHQPLLTPRVMEMSRSTSTLGQLMRSPIWQNCPQPYVSLTRLPELVETTKSPIGKIKSTPVSRTSVANTVRTLLAENMAHVATSTEQQLQIPLAAIASFTTIQASDLSEGPMSLTRQEVIKEEQNIETVTDNDGEVD